jgi:hypothetical protein
VKRLALGDSAAPWPKVSRGSLRPSLPLRCRALLELRNRLLEESSLSWRACFGLPSSRSEASSEALLEASSLRPLFVRAP